MRILITGSSGHLGEALVRVLRGEGYDVRSVDIFPGNYTTHIGSITDPAFIGNVMSGIDGVIHAATLHKPHVATHSKSEFIETNIGGTQCLLDAAIREQVKAFIFTSTTSTFGLAMRPAPGGPAVWVDEDLVPIPKNIYGVTKLAAENLCWLAHLERGLNTIILKTSRFFPEDDDQKAVRDRFSDDNAKTNEFLNRRADIEDMVSAHLCALERATDIGFGKYIISATPPFSRDDCAALMIDAPSVVARYFDYEKAYDQLGWSMAPKLDRVYDNSRARAELSWEPKHTFESVISRIAAGGKPLSELAYMIGKKGYHDQTFDGDGPYPVSS